MKHLHKWVAVFAATFLVAACSNSQTDEGENNEMSTDTTEAYIDAVEAAADHYRLLSEEGGVRVIEMSLPAGARDAEHSHYHETVYFISGGHANIHVGDEVMDAQIPDGHVMHHEPWTHSIENVGNSDIRAIIFERMGEANLTPIAEYIDAVEAAPKHYKLLSEEGNVRLIHMKLAPGEKDNLHSHQYETVYFLSGGKAKIHVGDDVMEADIPDGHVMHHEPWTHSVENAGKTTIEAIIFERIPPAK